MQMNSTEFTIYSLRYCLHAIVLRHQTLPFYTRQETFTKTAGKKSKTSVELDLGDMLAALEKQQQAMKARQLNNTKPLSFTRRYLFTLWHTQVCK